MYLWRAVDDEGEVLDVFVQKRRNKHAALWKLLKTQGIHPETWGPEEAICEHGELTCQHRRVRQKASRT